MAFFTHLYDTLVPSARNRYRPHAMSQKSLSLFSGLLLSAKLLTVFSVDAAPIGKAYSAAVTPQNIIQLTNGSREGAGISDLTENSQLDAAAQAKANDMLANQYFAHTAPSGKTPWDFISNSGYNYIIAGENLALNFFTAESTEQAWMNSPEHRANILNANFENIGVGVSQGEFNGVPAIFVVQEFGTPLPQAYAIHRTTSSPVAATSDNGATAVLTSAKPATLQVQATVSKLIPAPRLDVPQKSLISGTKTTVSGESEAASVYLAVNGVQQIQVPVTDGTFSATLNLDPGTNAITATAADDNNHVSIASQAVTYITATVMPQVLSAQVNPVPLDGGSSLAYQLVVHTLPSATSVNASYGAIGVVLQPTAIAGEWQTTIAASQLAQTQLVVHAYDMAGNVASSQQISFTSTISDNYAFQATPKEATIPILGKQISESALNDLYIGFALIMMVIIGIVVASRAPVADVAMIAQTAGLVALSVIFWIH